MKSHVVGGNGVMNIAPLAEALRATRSPIDRTALLAKALGLVARDRPEMRQCYMPLPVGHLYQHPNSVATIAVERDWRGEPAVFLDQIEAPEDRPLAEIDALYRAMQQAPLESIGGFRRLIRITRMPLAIRRGFWHFGLYGSGYLHSRYFGTFSISTMPVPRTEYMQTTTPLTMSVIYGFLEPNGDMPLQILVDHRVIDGMNLFRIARELEVALNERIAGELLQGMPAARAPSETRSGTPVAKEA
jgi:hypothetical protein